MNRITKAFKNMSDEQAIIFWTVVIVLMFFVGARGVYLVGHNEGTQNYVGKKGEYLVKIHPPGKTIECKCTDCGEDPPGLIFTTAKDDDDY